jgi:hypothetical protein
MHLSHTYCRPVSLLHGVVLCVSLCCTVAYGAGSVQCCKSVAPLLPPATPYGATMYRSDDQRSLYQPYRAMPIDAPATVKDMRRRLESRESEGGPYSPELVPELQGLGAALFEQQKFYDAIDTYGRAIHLLRVNEGLGTSSQAGIVEQIFEAQMALGDYVAADEQQDYLFRIRRDSRPVIAPEMLVSVEQYADWHRAAYLAELDRYRFPRIVQLFDLYTGMIDAVAQEHGELDQNLIPYLEGKLKTQYLLSIYPGEREVSMQAESEQKQEIDQPDLTRLRFIKFRDGNYRYGLQTIQQMRAIIAGDPQSRLADLAEVQLALGDWYQWHRRYAQAVSAYSSVWEMMEDETGGVEWLQDAFGDPVELPLEIVFQPGRMPMRLTHAMQVTAAFEVSRHGEAKDIVILSPTKKENQPAVTRGYKYLRDMRFRPRLLDGEVVAAKVLQRNYNIRY